MTEEKPILDSGVREQFDTGAQRDIQENKGLPSLLPCDAMIDFLNNEIEHVGQKAMIELFKFWRGDRDKDHLMKCLSQLIFEYEGKERIGHFPFQTMIDISVHFEKGAKKYNPRNWESGMPLSCYFNSAFRHIVKYSGGLKDEPHLIAAIWNVMCLQQTKIWIENKYLPEKLNDIPIAKPPLYSSSRKNTSEFIQRMNCDSFLIFSRPNNCRSSPDQLVFQKRDTGELFPTVIGIFSLMWLFCHHYYMDKP